MIKKRIVSGIWIMLLLILCMITFSADSTMPSYLNPNDGWERVEENGETYYQSPDNKVGVYAGKNGGSILLMQTVETKEGKVETGLYRDIVLRDGSSQVTYNNGRLNIVDVETKTSYVEGQDRYEITGYEVRTTTIYPSVDKHVTYSDTVDVPLTAGKPDPKDYVANPQKPVDLDKIYPISKYSPNAIPTDKTVHDTDAQLYRQDFMLAMFLEFRVLMEPPPFTTAQVMDISHINNYVQRTQKVNGEQIDPEEIAKNPITRADLEAAAAATGQNPNNFVFNDDMAEVLATKYAKKAASGGKQSPNNPASEIDGALTSTYFNTPGAENPNEINGRFFVAGGGEDIELVFEAEGGTQFTQNKDGSWKCTYRCGDSDGKDFPAEFVRDPVFELDLEALGEEWAANFDYTKLGGEELVAGAGTGDPMSQLVVPPEIRGQTPPAGAAYCQTG